MNVRTLANHYAAQLSLCFSHSSINCTLARTIHAHMIASSFRPWGHILNRLIDIYCKSSKIDYARQLFDNIPKPAIVARTTLIATYSTMGNLKLAKEIFNETPLVMRDTVSYKAMITAYSHHDDGHAAVELFQEMKREGFTPDNFTFSSVLSALALIADDEKHCQQLHCEVIKLGTWSVTSVINALICAYVHCASAPEVSSSLLMAAARKLFDEMPQRDETSWTIALCGFSVLECYDCSSCTTWTWCPGHSTL